MNNRHAESNAFRKKSVALAVAATLFTSFNYPLYAAESSDAAEDEEETNRVVITGSRISRDPNLASASPVQSIDSTAIRQTGEFSIADVVNDIPALFSSSTSEGSVDSGFADGANVLSLRGLGSRRTLVLVDGRRHVAGVGGQSAVDVGSIPNKLIERVDVLTGGASAVYGADAVTGVVNFILKDDYEGLDIDVQTGISSESDGQQNTFSLLWGKNFDDNKGNVTVAFDYRKDDGVLVSDRENGAIIGSARDWNNPELRFQQGDISQSSTPNLFQYFNFNNTGLTNFGLPIPSQDDFIADYLAEFGTSPNLTQAEIALFQRAASAFPRAVLPERTFPFTSGYGYIIPGNPFTFAGFDPATNIDLDGNGTPDCLDSFTGYNSVFGAASFGVVGGCWNVSADGSYAPVRDGLVSDNFEGFGGDSFNALIQPDDYIILPDEKMSINVLGKYEVSDSVTAFGEVKYVSQETENQGQPTSFWDLLFGAPDNPFLPAFIQPTAQATGGVAITIDPVAIGSGASTTERDTTRIVTGFEGSFDNGMDFEISLNWGQYEEEVTQENAIIADRFFAAIDAVNDGSGNPACRSQVDPTAPALTTPFNIPRYDPGYFSFTPGDGTCVPLNIWAGATGITQEAVDWVTVDTVNSVTLEQTVLSGYIAGDTTDWFELPNGPISFVAGFEYREESSETVRDPFRRGVLPAGSNFAPGSLISEHSTNNSLVFRPATLLQNEVGEYDVSEVFFEGSLPLLDGAPMAEELTFDFAARIADYSTIGNATTWKTNLFWQPISDLAIRVSVSEAVRAPNITELFAPNETINLRPVDPCDSTNSPSTQIQANCSEFFANIGFNPDTNGDGNYDFVETLTAAFPGIQGGNPDLKEETADTTTMGFVYQPEAFEGFSVSFDYWDIEIEDAIQAVSAQDIVNNCYRGGSLNLAFCNLITRNATTGNFESIRSTEINFAKLETAGFDFSIGYDFEFEDHKFTTKLQGTRVHRLNQFTNPSDLTEVNPELREVQRPELAGNVSFNWAWNDLSIGLNSQYMGEQYLAFVEVEQVENSNPDEILYDQNQVLMDEFWIHNLNASYKFNEDVEVYGGIRNVTDEEPFSTNNAFPTSARGRFFFVGVNYKM